MHYRPGRMALALVTLPISLLSAGAAWAEAPAEPADPFALYLDQCRLAEVCNGTYLVARKGKPIHRAAIGDAGDLDRSPLTMDSQFDIGSISKQFTAVAVLRLARQKRLALADPVARHLPAFPYPDITIAQLLSHTSGMPDVLNHYSALLRSGQATAPLDGSDIVSVLAEGKRPAVFAPGTKYAYNNSGYLVLAALVEARTGETFSDHLHRTLFKPLRMKRTLVRTPANEGQISRRAFGFQPMPDGTRRAYDQTPMFYIRGAGGIYSTVDDLLRWQNALSGGRILSPREWRMATTAMQLSDGTAAPYGYGFALRKTPEGLAKVGHNGHFRGFKSELAYFPASQVTVIQLTNNAQDDRMDANARALFQLSQGKAPPAVRPTIGKALYQRVTAGSEADTRQWFADQLSATSPAFELDEDELNRLGYSLLKAPDKRPAILVFELTVLAFPKSANAYDSLSEAQEAAGDTAAALVSSRMALALEPQSATLQKRVELLSKAPQ
ncbi:beta-lactamase family protein [Altererythrobacter sp. BO-6]|uniref:serine hydrolase domain-containing protein n=1 Tax=Altererythrobacter sp. BO-6 TaxID=2604537 RepID=UPI0013E11C04|nr:serine hydrolase domain-containing protein [Altererythrobacter sp. BO-6]QIG55195.1 beta-lactamase family protein [Altererythrobacter sp. BO-6]